MTNVRKGYIYNMDIEDFVLSENIKRAKNRIEISTQYMFDLIKDDCVKISNSESLEYYYVCEKYLEKLKEKLKEL